MRPTATLFSISPRSGRELRRSVHFLSTSCEWETPACLFDELSRTFGPFTLDPCATPENAKCPRYFTLLDDGLSRPWGGRICMNPPYGREIGRWVKKAWEESLTGPLVVCLLPARVDTRWWHHYARKGHVHFLQGRLKFGSSRNSAPFPSAIVVFGKFLSH